METLPNLPDEGAIVTIEWGFPKRLPEKAKVVKHIQTRNPFTGEVECYHILTRTVRGNYEKLIRVAHVKA